MFNFERWAEQYVVSCFLEFEWNVVQDGVLSFVKPLPAEGRPNRRSRHILIKLENDVWQELDRASLDRQEEIGRRTTGELVKQVPRLDIGEAGQEPITLVLDDHVLDR